jgi:hypothetical protein
MARRKTPRPDPELLVARIDRFEQSYYIAEDRTHQEPVQDEALIEITGTIEDISKRHKQHLGLEIEITLGCAHGFSDREPTVTKDRPFLLMMVLRKNQRSCMAYLPSASFRAIPRMIETGRVTHIEARFEPVRYGDGALLSLYLTPETKLTSV